MRLAVILIFSVSAVVTGLLIISHRTFGAKIEHAGALISRTSSQEQETSPPTPPIATHIDVPEVPTRSVIELEELVYRDPFNVDLQLELARASWKSFEKSMRTDSEAASSCATAYLFAIFESGSRPEIVAEARERINLLGEMAGGGDDTFDKGHDLFQTMYEKATKPNIQHILSVRKAIEDACVRINADDRGIEAVIAAQVAMERYLKLAYDVEVGRKQNKLPDGGELHFLSRYYENWEQMARSYGIIVRTNPDAANFDVNAIEGLSTPIDSTLLQVRSGDEFGRFQMPDGREIVPGLQYFEDAARIAAEEANADAASTAEEQKGLDDPSTVESPAGVYRRMLELRARGMSSAIFDLLEPETQRKSVDAVRSTLAAAMAGSAESDRLNSMSDRELWVVATRTGEVYPTRILTVQIDGDRATLRIQRIQDGTPREDDVGCVRIEGKWRITIE